MYTGNKSKYRVKNPSKYKGDLDNVIARSDLERRFMAWADRSPSVLEWGSEELIILYKSDVDNKVHRYFTDFYCKIRDKDGNTQKYVIEIKPEAFMNPPKKPKKNNQRYLQEVLQYMTNQSKFRTAEKYCEERGMKFLILNEKHLGA